MRPALAERPRFVSASTPYPPDQQISKDSIDVSPQRSLATGRDCANHRQSPAPLADSDLRLHRAGGRVRPDATQYLGGRAALTIRDEANIDDNKAPAHLWRSIGDEDRSRNGARAVAQPERAQPRAGKCWAAEGLQEAGRLADGRGHRRPARRSAHHPAAWSGVWQNRSVLPAGAIR